MKQITNPRWAGAVDLAGALPCVFPCACLLANTKADIEKGSAMSNIHARHSTLSSSAASSRSQRLTVAISAAVLGACLVYFAGFSHIAAVHNAAHDTRHSAGFPCH